MFGGGTRMSFGARIAKRYDASERALRANRKSFEAVFPQLRSVPFEMIWGGPIALTPDQIPKVGLLHDGRVAYAHGRDATNARTALFPNLARFVDAPMTATVFIRGDYRTAGAPIQAARSGGIRGAILGARLCAQSQPQRRPSPETPWPSSKTHIAVRFSRPFGT